MTALIVLAVIAGVIYFGSLVWLIHEASSAPLIPPTRRNPGDRQ